MSLILFIAPTPKNTFVREIISLTSHKKLLSLKHKISIAFF